MIGPRGSGGGNEGAGAASRLEFTSGAGDGGFKDNSVHFCEIWLVLGHALATSGATSCWASDHSYLNQFFFDFIVAILTSFMGAGK